MSHSDVEWVWFLVVLFGAIGFATPYVALEFGSNVAGLTIDSPTEATFAAVLNTISSILFWTFGVPVWLNVIFTAFRVMMWVILVRNTPVIGSGGA